MKKGKLLLKIVAVLCLLFALCFSVSAANHVEKIDVEVILNEDGSAKITFDSTRNIPYKFNTSTFNLKGLDASQIFADKENVFSFEIENCNFYRTEIFDETEDVRIAIGNPIWNEKQ